MSMIYALVSRGKDTVLSDYTPHSGNFHNTALDVLKKCDYNKPFVRFGVGQYIFYVYVKERFIFLAMVQADYQIRIVSNFLKQIQETFFARYDQQKRQKATSHSLTDFSIILKEKIALYNDKPKVDKLSNLKNHLSETQQICLANLDKVLERDQKISLIVQKSKNLNEMSYEIKNKSRDVYNKMWWKNKKIMIGIIIIALILIFLLVGIICGFTFDKC